MKIYTIQHKILTLDQLCFIIIVARLFNYTYFNNTLIQFCLVIKYCGNIFWLWLTLSPHTWHFLREEQESSTSSQLLTRRFFRPSALVMLNKLSAAMNLWLKAFCFWLKAFCLWLEAFCFWLKVFTYDLVSKRGLLAKAIKTQAQCFSSHMMGYLYEGKYLPHRNVHERIPKLIRLSEKYCIGLSTWP